ncbi:MAG: hypothetical protein QM763_23985 [Agriterribacter sp.]
MNYANIENNPILTVLVDGKPHKLLRIGTPVLAFIGMLILGISWMIKYPEIISAKGQLLSINQPKPLLCKINGKIVKLIAFEGMHVKADDILGLMESVGNHYEILSLIDTINNIEDENFKPFSTTWLNSFKNLGEVQPSFQNFVQANLRFIDFYKGGFFCKKRAMLVEDEKNMIASRFVLEETKALLEKDIQLNKENLNAQELLADQKVISPLDIRNERSKMLQKQLTVPEIKSLLLDNNAKQSDIKKQVLDLDNQIKQEQYIYQQALYTFRSSLYDWKKNIYLRLQLMGKFHL